MSEIKKNQQIALYTVELKTTSPFHIGAYQDPMSDVNSPFTTLSGVPVVQGASLKGALRAQLEEYLILNYPSDTAMKPCIPAPWNNLSKDERALLGQKGQPGPYRGSSCGEQRGWPKTLCPTCYLFGAQGLVGFVRAPYLYLVGEEEIEEVYENRRDRASNTVASGANRTLQTIPQGAVFRGTLEVIRHDHIRKWTLGQPRRKLQSYRDEWLEPHGRDPQGDFIREFILDRLEAIPRMGGFVSKGFGNVEMKVTPAGEKAV